MLGSALLCLGFDHVTETQNIQSDMRIVLFEVHHQRYLGDYETELTDLGGKITVKVAWLRN